MIIVSDILTENCPLSNKPFWWKIVVKTIIINSSGPPWKIPTYFFYEIHWWPYFVGNLLVMYHFQLIFDEYVLCVFFCSASFLCLGLNPGKERKASLQKKIRKRNSKGIEYKLGFSYDPRHSLSLSCLDGRSIWFFTSFEKIKKLNS